MHVDARVRRACSLNLYQHAAWVFYLLLQQILPREGHTSTVEWLLPSTSLPQGTTFFTLDYAKLSCPKLTLSHASLMKSPTLTFYISHLAGPTAMISFLHALIRNQRIQTIFFDSSARTIFWSWALTVQPGCFINHYWQFFPFVWKRKY